MPYLRPAYFKSENCPHTYGKIIKHLETEALAAEVEKRLQVNQPESYSQVLAEDRIKRLEELLAKEHENYRAASSNHELNGYGVCPICEALGVPKPIKEMTDGELLAYMGTDAMKWAEVFATKYRVQVPGVPVFNFESTKSFMISWFANAIGAGQSSVQTSYFEGEQPNGN